MPRIRLDAVEPHRRPESDPGRLVSRPEIRGALWDADTLIGFDQGVNDCVREIRQALNDSASQPRYVQTLPRRGYRFIAAVERAPVPPAVPVASSGSGDPRLRLALTSLLGG